MRIPVATYRLQFNGDFRFDKACELLDYLKELGISDLYASPLFLASPGSSHGYDVCSFNEINPAIGTRQELEQISAELANRGMGLLLDIVPNHMGNGPANCWWQDVLTLGPKSPFAHFFDIHWNSTVPGLNQKILLPVLGGHYSDVLERGELQVMADEEKVSLAYFANHFPLSPESIAMFGFDPKRADLAERLRDINGKPGDRASFDRLHALLEMQHYRLAYWRVGPEEINYRRFFDVTSLVSVRVEDEAVFAATHQLIFELLEKGIVTGLRIDHPDGLRDPATYFERLQARSGKRSYVVVEKILSGDEQLPKSWPVSGTTGYDYLNFLNGIFIRQENAAAISDIYKHFTSDTASYEETAARSKKEVLERMFVSEVSSLTRRLKGVAALDRFGVDLTESELRRALTEFLAAFPVYRNYLSNTEVHLFAEQLDSIQSALDRAKAETELPDGRALEFIARVLSLGKLGPLDEKARADALEFAIRFQQLSGPATAKGLEDTAFYRYTRFVSLNEVGGEPGRFGVSLDEFHRYNARKCLQWPHSLSATATHDTKRGEDVRARLNVLSEMPGEWKKTVMRWRELNASLMPAPRPSASDEYLIYQTLAGTWNGDSDLHDYIARIQAYMQKATREAKTMTSWTDPNESYEKALAQFVESILNNPQFVADLTGFSRQIAYFGMFNSLSQVLIKICSPGVPDFYQGAELWDFSLVDPDNRRPVDYAVRKQLLAAIRQKSPATLLDEWSTGAVKLFATMAALKARNEYRQIFEGSYEPLESAGERKNHLVGFARSSPAGTISVAVPRFPYLLTKGQTSYPKAEVWGNTSFSARQVGNPNLSERLGKGQKAHRYRNLITREELQSLKAGEIFQSFPVALLLALD